MQDHDVDAGAAGTERNTRFGGFNYRVAVLLAIGTVLLSPCCCAEEEAILKTLEIEEAVQFASEQGVDIRSIIQSAISGEVNVGEMFMQNLKYAREKVLGDFRRFSMMLMTPAVAMLVVRLMIGGNSGIKKTMALVCRVSCVAVLSEIFAEMRSESEALMQLIAQCSDLLTPVMITAVTLSGAETTALFLSPAAGICSNLIQHVLAQWGMGISASAAVISIAGNLSASVRLKRLYELCRKIVHIGAGGMLAAFMAILSIQGRLGASRDGAAVRTAHFAIETIIPVIGGNVSESLDSLLLAANLVKNALGVSACLLLAFICLTPMVRMLAAAISMHLAAAISEPLGDDSLTSMLLQLGGAIEMLLIVSAASAVLCGLLIGSCMSAVSNVVR